MDWGEGGLHWFDIYVNYRDNKRCKFCSWSIKKSGPCLVFKDRTSCYHWKPQKHVVEGVYRRVIN
ncbi:unnamed protein product [Linum tenue]|nr:unnamed protein product [Linum tenue]